MLEVEYDRACRVTLQITGERRLLDQSPVLQRSIAVRNPYVDPLSFLQVELLARRRQKDNRPKNKKTEPRDGDQEKLLYDAIDNQWNRGGHAKHRVNYESQNTNFCTALQIGETVNDDYIRLETEDNPGVISNPGHAFGEHGVSLHSIMQKHVAGIAATIVLLMR